jgi:hypothetical protein
MTRLKNFRYVPYSSLTLASRIKAARGEEDIVFNAQGGLTVKTGVMKNLFRLLTGTQQLAPLKNASVFIMVRLVLQPSPRITS